MKAPLSWLKDYVTIKLDPKTLAQRLTEIGLNTEKILEQGSETIFDIEITPNRPDLLSVIGIAREVAAIEQTTIRFPKVTIDTTKIKPKKTLPLTIKTDAKINPRFTGIILANITVKESPEWLKKRLQLLGARSINNIVDITNYVMFELGNPIHAFDYDKIVDHTMCVHQAKGGEVFQSVDGTQYHLPIGAVVISDKDKIIDLCGIKGGYNSGTFTETKNIFIRIPAEYPNLIRKTSQALGLRSVASSIFERGVNAGGTVTALNRCVALILELAGGEIASELVDIKAQPFTPWKLTLRLSRLAHILGVTLPEKEVFTILRVLNLTPEKINTDTIQATIPTYRNDLKLEEDLIEEVARIYGYNKFPKTLPVGAIPTQKIPHHKDYIPDEKAKQILTATGFSEVYTYSLLADKDLEEMGVKPERSLRVDNPVSREFEYLRPSLQINLQKALLLNKSHTPSVQLFELGKVYGGKSLDAASETYMLSGISNIQSFYEIKGILERIFVELGIKADPSDYIKILKDGVFFEVPYTELLKRADKVIVFQPLPKYPPVLQDLSLVITEKFPTGTIVETIKKQSPLIQDVTLLDEYQTTRTFHIIYQHKDKNLTTQDIIPIREKIIAAVKKIFHAQIK